MFSLITTTKNRFNFLKECAESVARQSVKPKQWIVIVDDTKQAYLKILKDIPKIVNYAEIYHYPYGRAKALSYAHKFVTSSHCMWLDDDDLLLADTVKAFSQYLVYDLIYGDFLYQNKGVTRLVNQGVFSFERLLKENCLFHPFCYSLENYRQCGEINTNIDCCLDYELRLRQVQYATPYRINKPLYIYRMGHSRISTRLRDKQREIADYLRGIYNKRC